MRYKSTFEIAAPAHRVWAVLSDVAAWPSWTPTVTSVAIAADRLAPGVEVRVTQPGRRAVTYTVDRVSDDRGFSWSSRRAGVHQWAEHTIKPAGLSACTLSLEFGMDGPVGGALAWLGAAKIRTFVDQEGLALRTHVESS